jgi:hypothetical protein
LELLPLLAERFNPQVQDALVRLGTLAGEAHDVLAGLAEELAAAAVKTAGEGKLRVDCRLLAQQPHYVVREMLCHTWRQQGWPLRDMTFRHWDELAKMAAAAPSGARSSRVFAGEIVVQAENQELRLGRKSAQ